jgi:drug/metabolite transporter (DMT)-like permease
MLDMASNVLFLVAVRGGQLVLVGLLASLSPLGTIGLARFVLRERIRVVQGIGAALAMGSVVLLALA